MEETIRALQQLEDEFEKKDAECAVIFKELLIQRKEEAHTAVHSLEKDFENEVLELNKQAESEIVEIEKRSENMVSRSIEMLNQQYLQKKDTSLEQVIGEIIYYGNC